MACRFLSSSGGGGAAATAIFMTAVVSAAFLAAGEDHPSVDNCSIAVHQHNWTAVLSCDVRHAFSSVGVDYHFRLLELHDSSLFSDSEGPYILRNIVRKNSKLSSEFKIHNQQSLPDTLQSYLNTTDNQTYYRGHLKYTWRLSSYSQGFKHATVMICTSPNPYECVTSSTGFIDMPIIARPGALSHNCSQLSYIPENGSITCACSTGSVGSPAGRLLWLLDNAVWTSGQYGVTQLSLSIESVTRNQTARQATCRLDWIDPQDAHLPLNVAYGPDRVELLVHHTHYDPHTGEKELTAECQVRGLNPRTPDMVQWEGPCQGQQGFTCTLDPGQTGLSGKTVTCRVTNSANNGHSASADKVIDTVMGLADCSSDDEEEEEECAVAVTGDMMFNMAVVVLTLLTMMMVTWMCRRGLQQPSTAVSDSAQQTEKQQTNDGALDLPTQ